MLPRPTTESRTRLIYPNDRLPRYLRQLANEARGTEDEPRPSPELASPLVRRANVVLNVPSPSPCPRHGLVNCGAGQTKCSEPLGNGDPDGPHNTGSMTGGSRPNTH